MDWRAIAGNILLALKAVLGSSVYLLATLLLGRLVLRRLKVDAAPFVLPVAAVTGIVVFSGIVTGAALLHVAHTPVIVLLALVPLMTVPREAPGLWANLREPISALWRHSPATRGLAAVIALYLLLAAFICIVNPIGGDLGNYHLVIPRDVLWNHGFIFNPFTHEAGIPYGWNLYGVPAFLLGGDRGYVFLSFWAMGLLLLMIFQGFRARDGILCGALSTIVAAYLVSGLARNYLSNNDVPLVLVEAVALVLAVAPLPMPNTSRALLFGSVSGLALAIKPIVLPGLLLLIVLFTLRSPARRSGALVMAGLAALPLAGIWPLVTYLNTGSALPQFMMALRTQGPPPPHMIESMGILHHYFGIWYAMNYARFFTAGMEGHALLLAGIPAGLVLSRRYRTDRLVWLLLGFGLGRAGLMLVLTRRPDLLLHDRYHLISYLALGLAGLQGWWHLLAALPAGAGILTRTAAAVALGLLPWQLTGRFEMRSPDPAVPAGFASYVAPSMVDTLVANLRSFQLPQGAGPNGGLYDWMARYLPKDALIATTVVDPYHIQRRTIQLLPISQDRIDLAQPAAAILAELRHMGVTHLHLTRYSGLNGWMNRTVDAWLKNVRAIPEQSGVDLVMLTLSPSDKGDQALYRVVGDTAPEPSDRGVDRRPQATFRAERLNSFQVTLLWEPDRADRYELSIWDTGRAAYRVLGFAGHGQSTFLAQGVTAGTKRFRIRPIYGTEPSGAADVVLAKRARWSGPPTPSDQGVPGSHVLGAEPGDQPTAQGGQR